MTDTRFDPGGFFEFNLAEGAVRTREGVRVLVLADTVLAPLVSAAVEHGDLTAIRRLGRVVGQHALSSLGGSAGQGSPEGVLSHAAAALALFGWGRLRLQRWGHALVAEVGEAPELDDQDLGVAALLGGILSALGDREVACVPVSGKRFLIVSPGVAQEVWTWSREGTDLNGILRRLAPAESA